MGAFIICWKVLCTVVKGGGTGCSCLEVGIKAIKTRLGRRRRSASSDRAES